MKTRKIKPLKKGDYVITQLGMKKVISVRNNGYNFTSDSFGNVPLNEGQNWTHIYKANRLQVFLHKLFGINFKSKA